MACHVIIVSAHALTPQLVNISLETQYYRIMLYMIKCCVGCRAKCCTGLHTCIARRCLSSWPAVAAASKWNGTPQCTYQAVDQTDTSEGITFPRLEISLNA